MRCLTPTLVFRVVVVVVVVVKRSSCVEAHSILEI